MVKEDPIEKLERKQAEKKANGGLKAVMIAMIVIALGLAAALAYVMTSKNKLVDELNQEKVDLTEQIQALQSDYENLSSEYDTINAQLDSSREEIAQLVDRVKKTEATDRAKIRQYEKELGTLRSIMRSYINQIDSLNTLNHRLTEEAATARKEAEQTKQINTQLTQQVEDLTSRVTAGSILKAHNFVMYAYNNNDKITDKANRVVRFLVNLSLNENELAERGPVRIYVRVTDPDGNLLTDGRGTTFTFNGETLDATASREVDYQGKEVDLGIYVNNVASFKKGIYTVNAYTTQAQLGHGELLLR
ncbi:MAG: hypothetical protein K5849_05785 [Bacteroidales bacterium]|nr:hypothetical protein [Bacteroidales bacterium]